MGDGKASSDEAAGVPNGGGPVGEIGVRTQDF